MKTGLFAACLVVEAVASGASVARAEPAAADKPASSAGAETTAAPAAQPTIEGPQPVVTPESSRSDGGAAGEAGGHEPADEDYGHGMQLGLRAGLVGGYRMIFRYDKSPFCRAPEAGKSDKDQQKFCGHGAPLALDVALSFAPLDFAEPYVWARFGLGGESQTNTEPLMAFGAGARIYTMSDSKLKIFVEPAVGVEVEGGAGNDDWRFSSQAQPEYKTDLLFHLGVGPQYDFARAVGVYLNAGLTTGVLRYIHTELEITGGVQVRVP